MSKLTFGQRFRIARINADMTLKEAAAKMNRTRQTVASLEDGESINARTRAMAIQLFPELVQISS